jgi:tetratricopeptide (TPR) repeat protein
VAEEREADEYGIFYMSLAGFNPEAIVPAGEAAHFFMAWLRSQDPFHPSPPERALAVKERLRKVAESVDLFQVGLWFYHARDYARAVNAFEEFRKIFPSREVYLNLATSHHQLALENYRQWKKDELALPWKLSLAIDPVTRASVIALRGPRSPAELFTEHLDRAIEFYQKAIAVDPSYALAYNNLGCALILSEDVYQAIAMLQKTLKVAPDSPEALNNLGVAFVAAEIPGKARPYLAKAHELAPGYEAPLFNLGKLAYDERNEAEVTQYWMGYLQLDPSSPWADAIRQRLSVNQPMPVAPPGAVSATEHLLGVQVGWFRDEIPLDWGEPAQISDIVLGRERFKMAVYKNRVLILLLDDAIHLLATRAGFRGSSARGVAAGTLEAELRARYGPPSRILKMTQGASWVYEAQGITFQLHEGKVVSWQLF